MPNNKRTDHIPTFRFGRRAFGGTFLGGLPLMLLAPRIGRAQQSPPIEPRDQTPETEEDEDTQIIEPELQPTISPDEDADTVLELAETGSSRYFATTGHNLNDPFLAAWELAGGMAGPGDPLSEQRYAEADGGIRQDFAGMAFVYQPDEGEQGAIRGVAIPEARAKVLDPAANQPGPGVCTSSAVGCQVVTSTGHTVSGQIGTFWSSHGGEQLLGAPIAEPVQKGNLTSQVFANAVLQQSSNGQVSLQPINRETVSGIMTSDAAFAPVPPSAGVSWLVQAEGGLNLRSAPAETGSIVATVPDNAEFIAAPGGEGLWVPGYVDGFSGWVARSFLTSVEAPAAVSANNWRLDVWEGSAMGETNVRREPNTTSTTSRSIEANAPLVVTNWVRGEAVADNQITWAELEGGGFVYARNLRRSAPISPPPLPVDAPSEGKWIDVHLTQQLMVAYEGRTPVRTIVTTTGMPGWETPTGWFSINTRVANETMESGSIGAENFYVLKDVLFTQYFTDRGHALHYAWWKSAETIGRPGSHGCLNLLLEDSQFLWDWATIGTPVICRTEQS